MCNVTMEAILLKIKYKYFIYTLYKYRINDNNNTCEEDGSETTLLNGVIRAEDDPQCVALGCDKRRQTRAAEATVFT